jgi:hypothetical protein
MWKMARYIVRRGSTGQFWMVWDREKRGPAMVGDRALVRLTQGEAELALVGLTGQVRQSPDPADYKTWLVTYGAGASVSCLHEVDAKLLARELIKRGHKVSAKTMEGVLPSRSIEPHQVYAWLAE